MIYNNSDKIEQLFETLQTTKEENQINRIEGLILSMWQNTGDELLDSIIFEGISFIENKQLKKAHDLFTQLVRLAPWWAEAWSKRATVAYMMGNYKASLSDLTQTLKREPRHFEALTGLASIYEELLLPYQALVTLNKLKQIAPYRNTIKKQIKELKKQRV